MAVSELAPRGNAVVTQVADPELTVTGLHASVVVPYLKVSVPAAVVGETVAVRVTLAPKAAVVMAVAGADVSPATSVVVAVVWVIETVFAVEVLAVSSTDVVGVKTAVSESLPTGSVVETQAATPEPFGLMELHSAVPLRPPL